MINVSLRINDKKDYSVGSMYLKELRLYTLLNYVGKFNNVELV